MVKLFKNENKINIKYCNNNKKGFEYIQTDNEEKILYDLSNIYKEMLIEYNKEKQYKDDNNKIIQIEKTKQKELEFAYEIEKEKEKTKQLELEILKMKIQLKLLSYKNNSLDSLNSD